MHPRSPRPFQRLLCRMQAPTVGAGAVADDQALDVGRPFIRQVGDGLDQVELPLPLTNRSERQDGDGSFGNLQVTTRCVAGPAVKRFLQPITIETIMDRGKVAMRIQGEVRSASGIRHKDYLEG